jgi:F0F1-type ATP synthase assembly protein I
MQYSWAIAIILVLLIGSCSAGIVIQRRGMRSSMGRNIQIGTTIAIFGILLHNIFWDREIEEIGSRGWTLICTLPAFLICIIISGFLATVFSIRLYRNQAQSGDTSSSQKR